MLNASDEINSPIQGWTEAGAQAYSRMAKLGERKPGRGMSVLSVESRPHARIEAAESQTDPTRLNALWLLSSSVRSFVPVRFAASVLACNASRMYCLPFASKASPLVNRLLVHAPVSLIVDEFNARRGKTVKPGMLAQTGYRWSDKFHRLYRGACETALVARQVTDNVG